MSEGLEWHMGNDDKIKDLIERGKSRFLPETLDDADAGREIYSLPDEYAKTKKNKPVALYFFILGFVSAVVVSTLLYTLVLEKQNRNMEVHFTDFDDLRLKEVLDAARGTDSELELARGALQALEVEKLEAILDLRKSYQRREVALIIERNGAPDTAVRVGELRKKEARDIAALSDSYDRRVSGKRRQISSLIRKKEAEERKLRKHEKKAAGVSNEDRLYRLRTQSMKKANEAGIVALRRFCERDRAYLTERYNPFFKSPSIAAMLEGPRDNMGDPGRYFRSYNDIITTEGVFTRDQFLNMRNRIMNQGAMIHMLQGLAYENSVPDMLAQLDHLSGSICNDYESLWSGLAGVIRRKNDRIASFETALNYMLREKPESGYIIDTRDEKSIVVYMNRILQIREGETAYVFRNDDEYIGKIQFFHTGEGLRARISEYARGASIRPFDKILMQKIQEKP